LLSNQKLAPVLSRPHQIKGPRQVKVDRSPNAPASDWLGTLSSAGTRTIIRLSAHGELCHEDFGHIANKADAHTSLNVNTRRLLAPYSCAAQRPKLTRARVKKTVDDLCSEFSVPEDCASVGATCSTIDEAEDIERIELTSQRIELAMHRQEAALHRLQAAIKDHGSSTSGSVAGASIDGDSDCSGSASEWRTPPLSPTSKSISYIKVVDETDDSPSNSTELSDLEYLAQKIQHMTLNVRADEIRPFPLRSPTLHISGCTSLGAGHCDLGTKCKFSHLMIADAECLRAELQRHLDMGIKVNRLN